MMEMSQDIKELAKALCAFQKDMVDVPKKRENPYFKSKYADLSDIMSSNKALMTKHGLCVSQVPESLEGRAGVTTVLLHVSGQFIKGTHFLRPVKDDPQGFGSAFTYARRYGLSSILGIVSDDDDDANEATHGSPSPAKPTKPAKPFRPIETKAADAGKEIYQASPADKKWLLSRFEQCGLKDTDLRKDVNNLLMNKPRDLAHELIVDALKEQQQKKETMK